MCSIGFPHRKRVGRPPISGGNLCGPLVSPTEIVWDAIHFLSRGLLLPHGGGTPDWAQHCPRKRAVPQPVERHHVPVTNPTCRAWPRIAPLRALWRSLVPLDCSHGGAGFRGTQRTSGGLCAPCTSVKHRSVVQYACTISAIASAGRALGPPHSLDALAWGGPPLGHGVRSS